MVIVPDKGFYAGGISNQDAKNNYKVNQYKYPAVYDFLFAIGKKKERVK
jgi:hypothetical protein